MECTALKDLGPDSFRAKVRVRFARVWEFRSPDKAALYAVDFVVVDGQKTTMEGSIPGKRWDQFKDLIKEGSVYTVEKFDLVKPKKTYRSVDSPLRISFTWRTKVAEIVPPPDNFPIFAYTALPLNMLSHRVDSVITLSDVVGLVNKVTPLLPPSGKAKTHRRQLYITDGSTHATVTLWGEQADSLDVHQLIAASAQGPIIVLFVGMTVGQYSGLLALQSTSVTRCYVNAPLPEIADVREKTKDLPYRIEWYTGKNKNDAEPIPSSITEISTFEPNDIMGMRYKISVRVTEIHEGDGWYYISCTDCWKKLIPENGNYRCPDCTTTVPLPRFMQPRIKIKLIKEGTYIVYLDQHEETTCLHTLLEVHLRYWINRGGLYLTQWTPSYGSVPETISEKVHLSIKGIPCNLSVPPVIEYTVSPFAYVNEHFTTVGKNIGLYECSAWCSQSNKIPGTIRVKIIPEHITDLTEVSHDEPFRCPELQISVLTKTIDQE